MSAAAGLLCCCGGGGCSCGLTSVAVTWTGSIQYAAVCGVCTPGEGQTYWTVSALASHDDKTVIQDTPSGDICTGFGNKSADPNGADAESECTPPDPPAVIEFPLDPTDDTLHRARLRFTGPALVTDGGGAPLYYRVLVAGIGSIDQSIQQPFSLEFRLAYSAVACPMVGTYTYEAAASTEPANWEDCPGFAPTWSFGSFSAGSVVVS